MKRKVLLLLFSGCLALGAFAQGQVQDNTPKFPVDPTITTPELPKTTLFQKGGAVSGWVDMADYLNFSLPGSGFLQQYASFIFPDSNVIYIPESDSGFYWYQTAVGSVFDPADPNQEIYTEDYFTRRDSYTWDSLAVLYIYRRGTIDTNIVDTLYIDLYTESGLSTRGTFSTNQDVHARPGYNGTTKRGTGSFKTITVLLTPADETTKSTTGWGFGLLNEAVNQAIPALNGDAPNMIGFTLNFRPGYTYNQNDTMEVSPSSSLTPDKTLSYFGYRQWVNEGGNGDLASQIRNNEYYTLSLIQRKEQFYGGNVNGWTGYLPGNAFFERQYVECAFHLTGNSTVDVKELNQFGSALGQAYPNPANANSTLNIEYAVNTSTNVTIEIYDIFGNKVKTVVNGAVEAGEHTATVDISDLASGVYVYTMTDGNNYASSQKVSIIR